MENVRILEGNRYRDYRGEMLFNNNFDLSPVKRMYIIQLKPNVIRAWQGHNAEHKWLMALSGKIKLNFAYRPTDKNLNEIEIQSFILSAEKPFVVHLPGAYINGFEGLTDNAVLQVFSNMTVAESEKDGYRISLDELNWK
jgi:dTDP-4-dehydrorhamnose 3,5-epimerase